MCLKDDVELGGEKASTPPVKAVVVAAIATTAPDRRNRIIRIFSEFHRVGEATAGGSPSYSSWMW